MRLVPTICPVLLCAAVMAQGVSLVDIPKLARKRLAVQQQRLLAALEPYMQDLRLDGNSAENLRYLEPKFAEIAAFGDAIIPILLDLLTPDEDSGEKRAMASNSARILRSMQPQKFLPALETLVSGDDPQGRRHAIDLLGQTDDPRAAQAIAKIFATLRGELLNRALHALGQLGSDEAADAAIQHLESHDAKLRRRVLIYLRQSRAKRVSDRVHRYFSDEKVAGLRPLYVRYFCAVAKNDTTVADSLAPMLTGTELDPNGQYELADSLGNIAPKGHQPSIDALLALIENGAHDRTGIAAALSLRELGEDRGKRELFNLLNKRIRQTRNDGRRYSDRAEANFAFGNWKRAKKDFESALRHSRANASRSATQLRLAHCEAHLGKARPFLNALKSSGLDWDSIMAEARQDGTFARALEDAAAKKYLASLKPEDGQP